MLKTIYNFISDRNLFPATKYLTLVWETFAQCRRLLTDDMAVIFENCRFVRAVTMPKTGFVKLLITIGKGDGKFEVLEKDQLVVSGRLRALNEVAEKETNFPPIPLGEDPKNILEHDEIYRELYLRGYNYR